MTKYSQNNMKKTIKESILTYFELDDRIYEYSPVEGKDDPEVNDPDKDAENPNLEGLYKSKNTLLFLTSNNSDGIIKKGDQMGWIEITKDSMENGLEVDLEDFQWVCPTEEFKKYLNKTGRQYSKKTGKWSVKDKQENIWKATEEPLIDESSRKISSFENFILENNILNEKEAEFKGGELDDTQRKFLKFYFTKNGLDNKGLMKKQLNLNNLKPGDLLQIFQCPFDTKTGKTDKMATTSVTFEVKSVMKSAGSITKPVVIGHIIREAPYIDKSSDDSPSALEDMVQSFSNWYDSFNEVFMGSITGKIYTFLAGAAALSGIVTPIGVGAAVYFYKWRYTTRINSLLNSGTAKNVSAAKAILKGDKSGGIVRRLKSIKNSRIANFVKYPYKLTKRIIYLKKRSMPVVKGWKAAKYAMFGAKSAKYGAQAAKVGKIAKAASSVGKWSNPVGWILLLGDAIGSGLNYTSDNQAPSWDPKLGGSGDSLKDYNLSGATNVFKPSKIPVGENITLCWTQNPEKGWGLALSFVVSNSTRTTMDLTKIHDFTTNNDSFTLFFINNVNYEGLWNKIKGNDLRFLFIKDGVYKEGWSDDNIGAYYLGVNVSKNPEDSLPISYYGHCGYLEFDKLYKDMPDQLVTIDEDAPNEYNFHFEDLESNIINVKGIKITNNDIKNSSSDEIDSFFNVQPKYSYIGNPKNETEEERKSRENLKNQKEESEEESTEETSEEKNESNKWYSSLEKKSIVSFNDFKHLKESYLLEDDEEDLQGGNTQSNSESENVPSTPEEFEANYENILNNIQGPLSFSIYIVLEKEYANPDLRDIYQPGTFTNFVVDNRAIKASDGEDIEELVQVNNLDLLLDAKKGIYEYRRSEETVIDIKTDTEEEKSKEEKSNNTVNSIESKDDESDKEESKNFIDKINTEDKSKLGIEDWEDITNVKVIRDKNGNPETIKFKNSKADFGDKSRRIDKEDSNFEAALNVANEFNMSKPTK
jgi:hypothetical protein